MQNIIERPYTDEDKIQAQHFLYEDQKDNIVQIEGFTVDMSNITTAKKQVENNKMIPTQDIVLSKDSIQYHRVWNIINNFQEAQKKSNNGIVVYKNADKYIVLEGNHRVVAAKYLGMKNVFASEVYKEE